MTQTKYNVIVLCLGIVIIRSINNAKLIINFSKNLKNGKK